MAFPRSFVWNLFTIQPNTPQKTNIKSFMNIKKDIAKEQRTEGIESLNFVEFFKLINKNQNLGQTSSWSCLVNNRDKSK